MDKIIKGLQGKTLSGKVEIPASKSHTIRALLIAAMASGKSELRSPLISRDTLSCLQACRLLGAEIVESEGLWTIEGTGGNITAPAKPLDVGNSGTTLYLATAMASLSKQTITFDGDEQIRNRSAGNLLKSLIDLGVEVKSSTSIKGLEHCAPYSLTGPLQGGKTTMECPVSQYLSALLLAAPLIPLGQEMEIEVPLLHEQPYVQITLDWLDRQNIRYSNDNFKNFRIPGGQKYNALSRRIPGDYSSATFFFCAAAITGATLEIGGLDKEDPQGDKEVLNLLQQMGCRVHWKEDICIIQGGTLHGISMDLNSMPDALPALAVTACFAQGETRIHNVPQARMKETDRITCMAAELTKMGAHVQEEDAGLVIQGNSSLQGCELQGYEDHRIVMALSLAALKAEGESKILGADAAAVTFPGYFELLESIMPKN
ncbi:MAG: 3-phosphoshikimate 1-carboxyvinyltransferase [Spirochaetaceae bacterium]|jgi:3-phosphoshikimate 1-carboxyvinyltransferase|nr:3-phosphoshikimate 1-carboxyvinyltransferase [Spirochaetaceae bacterium]